MQWRRMFDKLKWYDWLFLAALLALTIALLQPPTLSGGRHPRSDPSLMNIEEGRPDDIGGASIRH